MIRTPSLRSLDLFVTLMEVRSLSVTARRIGISQPAASLALKELEAQVGVPLFVRTRQRLVPTPQADRLLPHAERLIGQAQLVHREIAGLRANAAACIRLACTPAFGSTLLPETLRGFYRERPDVEMKIDVEPLARILDLLRREAVDVAFAYVPPTGDSASHEMRQEPLLTTPLACLMHADHRLSAHPLLTAADLAEETVILATRGYLPVPPGIVEDLQRDGVSNRLMAVNNVYTAMSLARAGIGIALANPLLLLGSDGPGLIARPFHPAVPLMLGVLRALPHADTPEIEALVRHAKGVASSSVGPLRALGIDVSVPVLQGHG